MNVFSLFASLELDSKGYIQNLKTAERESERTAGAIADRFDRIGEAATRLGQTISLRVTAPIAALATVAVRSFAQQEQAELRLRAALEANGREVDSLFNRYTAFASSLQDVTIIGDEVTIAMLAQAEALGLTGDTAERAITNAIGLSSALGINAESALRYTAVLEEGDTTMLQRYLPALRGVEDQSEKVALAQEMLGNMFSSATAQAASASGQLTQMRNAVGDLAEAFGEIIVGPLLPFVNRLQDLAERAQNMDESTLRLIVQVGALAAAVGPALLVLGQLAFAIRNIAIAFGALSAAMLPLLGAAGVIAAVAGGFYLLQRSFNTNAEAINEQRLFVQDLMSDYAEYRTQLNITSVAERQAALDRMRTIREELRDRLNILEAAAAEETARVEGWLNNPFIKFLLPGFIDVEAGANQGTLAAIEEVRTSLQLLDDDVQALEEGRFILESFSTRPLRQADEFVETFGSEYPEALDAATEATDRLDAATRRAMRNQQEFQRLMSEGRDVTGVTPGLGGGPAVGLVSPQVQVTVDEEAQRLALLAEQRAEREAARAERVEAIRAQELAAFHLERQTLVAQAEVRAEFNSGIDLLSKQLTARAERGDGGLSNLEPANRALAATTEFLGHLGERALSVAQQSFPLLSNAMQAFATGGPLAALGSVFVDLIGRTEGFQRLIEVVNSLLQPLINALEPLLNAVVSVASALEPLFQIVGQLIEVAFAPLTFILTNIVAPVFEWLANTLRTVWNTLFGWIFGKIGEEQPGGGGPGTSESPFGNLEETPSFRRRREFETPTGARFRSYYHAKSGNNDVTFFLDTNELKFGGQTVGTSNILGLQNRVGLLRRLISFVKEPELRTFLGDVLTETQGALETLENQVGSAPVMEAPIVPPPSEGRERIPTPDVGAPAPPDFSGITPRDMGASLGSIPQGVQLAVAVPLMDAANAFGSHVNSFGGYIDRLVTEGIAVNMGAASRTAALR